MRTVLVSGASGILGFGILRSLKKSLRKFKLIGTSIYEDSAALGFCDIFELAPQTSDPRYIDWLFHIIEKHSVEMIIPGIEADVYQWSESLSSLKGSGVVALLNSPYLISICKDKWVFYEELEKARLPYLIETTLNPDYTFLESKFNLPFLLKPRQGHGSKGIVRVDSRETFLKHQEGIGEILMAQPVIGNDNEEFTTSAFCDGNGNYYASITLRRKLARDGYTEKAEVVTIEGMEKAVESLCSIFKPYGPTNFQFRRDNTGLKLLEINPRISSSTSLRTAFGYNEALMAVDFFLENKIPQQPLILPGKAVRYTEDLIFYT
jgi:carbamoyl-phosphate synthase large subunit